MPTDVEAAPARLTPPPALPARAALFLDMDGVLAPIVATPDAVRPDARRTRALERLARALDGRLAVLSGRTVDEIDRICEGVVPCVAGVHGLERRDATGRLRRLEPAQALRFVHENLLAFAATRPGLMVEDKGLALALHYRQAPECGEEARALAETLSARHDLTLQPGHMVLEIKTPGADKGRALRAFMDEAPFVGASPVMAGDDLTDEFAFAAAADLGGFGVLVGPPRPTAATHGLADTDAVMRWLETLAEGA